MLQDLFNLMYDALGNGPINNLGFVLLDLEFHFECSLSSLCLLKSSVYGYLILCCGIAFSRKSGNVAVLESTSEQF